MTDTIYTVDGDRGISYGYVHKWTNKNRGKLSVSGWGFETRSLAEDRLLRALELCGYTAPHFWQWWRWSEARLEAWPRRDAT